MERPRSSRMSKSVGEAGVARTFPEDSPRSPRTDTGVGTQEAFRIYLTAIVLSSGSSRRLVQQPRCDADA
jgi:hypothetical protein